MSDFRAIGTVTEALRARLQAEARKEDGFAGADGTAEAPDALPKPTEPTINVYLYQVSPNTALRNADLPSRDSGGGLLQRPRAALDLHYLISTYGAGLEPQHLLGIVVRSLHSAPFLTRTEIDAAAVVTKSAFGSEVDSVKFTPDSISLEDLSKLWSVFFQTKYALSATYQASLVTVEGRETASPALPVRTRQLRVLPTLGPVIDHIESSTPADPVARTGRPILAGDTLHIVGHNLRGDATRIRLGGQLLTPTSVENDRITLVLAAPLRAGIDAVQVVQDVDFGVPSGKHRAFESNAVPFVLAPRVTTPTHAAGPAEQVTVAVQPDVAQGQRLVLMLAEKPGGGDHRYTFTATASAAGGTQAVPVQGVANGSYLTRLQVDGAASPLEVDASGQYSGPTLNVP